MYFKKSSEERHVFRKINYMCYDWVANSVPSGQTMGTTFIILER